MSIAVLPCTWYCWGGLCQRFSGLPGKPWPLNHGFCLNHGVCSLSGWSMLAGVLASAGAFLSYFLVAFSILGNDCTGFFSCDLSRPDLAIGWYSFLMPAVAFVGSIMSNSRARLGAIILIAVGATAVPTTIITFLPFFGSGDVGLAFSLYTLAYASWEVLLFYAGYLSLKGRKSQQGKRRIWDPDLEPLEANFSP